MSIFIVVFGFICSINCVTSSFHGHGTQFQYITNELKKLVGAIEPLSTRTSVTEKWLEQPIDHFNSRSNRTWKMRYYERTDLWKEGKPIYLFLGGESAARPEVLQAGTMLELAKETNGALYATEHRYYGESKPFEHYTPENLEFLSSRQAIADYANFLKFIKSSPKFKESKVVVVGGSYPGNLAAWMRLVYPDLVDAAYASSAPVLAKVDFFEYLEKVSDDFKQYGSSGCWDRIAEKFAHYEKAFQTKEGTEALKKEENICVSCDMNNELNQELFFYKQVGGFMGIAQYASTINDFKSYCDRFDWNSLLKYIKIIAYGQNWNNKSGCYCPDFDGYIQSIKMLDMGLQWTYQTCTEFGYYQTGSSGKQPFTKKISIDLYYKTCEKLFGPNFNANRVQKSVEETNLRYGGLKPNMTKVVFVNGDLDPWSTLSILEDLSPDVPSIKISQSSHCRDLFPKPNDSDEMKKAIAHIKSLIKSWVREGV